MPNAFYYGDNLEVLRASTSMMRARIRRRQPSKVKPKAKYQHQTDRVTPPSTRRFWPVM
jgi:hypothetical protein